MHTDAGLRAFSALLPFLVATYIIGMWLHAAGEEASLNIKGACLEVWSDMLGRSA